jgi:hypothetical protein
MRRAAGAHVVFRMYLEETDRLGRGKDVAKMCRLKADAGARWKMRSDAHATSLKNRVRPLMAIAETCLPAGPIRGF